MQLDLKKLFDGVEMSLPFSYGLDLSQFEQWGEKPFQTPVLIQGSAQNQAGIISVTYTAEYTLSASCGRCLEPVVRKQQHSFTHTVLCKLNQQKNDDFIVVEDGILDLDSLAQDDIFLELPIRMLCTEDCKGLCPQCGCNWNKQTCTCQPDNWDSNRIRAFEKYL